MSKILILSGPTASGKTNLAVKLAKKYNGELISADSRQVYQGMGIVTGKDLPSKAEFTYKPELNTKVSIQNLRIGTYEFEEIPVWGLDLVKPDQAFDVTTFVAVAQAIITDIHQRQKLPILVGGTGFYLKSLLQPQPSFGVPQNLQLRQELGALSLVDLQTQLQQLDPTKWHHMNHSDQQNPRRLVRAIEVAISKDTHPASYKPHHPLTYLWLGLNIDKDQLKQRIHERVLARIQSGAELEVKKLIHLGYDWQLPSMSALGYKEWKAYLTGNENTEELIEEWTLHEYQYAKRQMTWFKAEKSIEWLDVNHHPSETATAIIQKWLHNH